MAGRVDRQAQVLLMKAAEDEAVLHLAGTPDGPFGFHAQQAIEKLLKALLCQLSIEFKRTHDLEYLAAELKAAGEALPVVIDFSQVGTFAVTHRYDDIPEYCVLDRASATETVRILRQHILARIAALSSMP